MRIQHYGTGPARRRSAFTLMEIMVVVTILVILASVAGVGVFRYIDQANEGVARSNATAIGKALVSYKLAFGEYPDSLEGLVTPPGGAKGYLEPAALIDPWGGRYLFNPEGQFHNGQTPDVYTMTKEGRRISNAPKGQDGQN